MAFFLSLRSFFIQILVACMLVACGGGGDDTPPADTTPNTFTFAAVTDVALGSTQTTSSITVSGINSAASISVSGGEYALDGDTTFTSSAGTVNNGQTIVVRGIASSEFSTETTVTLTIGGVSGNFSITTLAQDLIPESFSFDSVTNAALATPIPSTNSITVAGINDASPISISNGEYSTDGGTTYTSAAGTVNNSDSVQVRLTSAAAFSTETVATLTIGGVEGTFSVTTLAQDLVPDAFSFDAITNVARSAVVTSANTITVSGINDASPIAISNGEYSTDGGATFTSDPGTVNNNDAVQVRLTSAATFSTAAVATLSIGGVEGTFSATTLAQDLVPDAFSFSDADDVELSTLTTSANSITVAGINDATTISVSGGEYNIDSGSFTSTAGTVTNGQSVQVRGTSAAATSTATVVTLTIGGVDGTFTITTLADTTAPTVSIAFPPPASMTEGATVTVRGTAEDDYSEIASLQVNGIDVTDTSDDGSYATWSVSVPLSPGENSLTVSVSDEVPNTNASAASVAVRRDATLGDFPDSDNPLSWPFSFAIDYERNRAIIGDFGVDTLIAMDLDTGVRTAFSDNTTPDGLLPNNIADGLLIDAENDRLWVTNSIDDILYEVNLLNGDRTIKSSPTEPDSDLVLNGPTEMIFHPESSDELIVFNGDAMTLVNIGDGSRSTFSSHGGGDHLPTPNSDNSFANTRGGIYDALNARFLVVDEGRPNIVSVALSDGGRTVFSDNTTPNSDAPLFDTPRTIVLDDDNNRVLVNDNGIDALIAVVFSGENAGARSIFSDPTTPDTINSPVEPEEVFYDGNLGYAFWVDRGLDAVLAVDIETGERVFVTKGDSPE